MDRKIRILNDFRFQTFYFLHYFNSLIQKITIHNLVKRNATLATVQDTSVIIVDMINTLQFNYSAFSQSLEEKELGNASYKKKDFETALAHYKNAIELDPTNASFLTNRAGQC